ncbi:hypothetical protein HNQ59_001129 [Chitinivorax tropicus]|uniref:TonB C-terminal domain-containing protein n=1 Tax=Chitinivorax tropicus TaxID=714531 RepID=A0A840ML44_9PROT|nr:energy transducer TonB [Chitinivorax tropicus]MBB5017859.1 hypothetical protein [Chitinivorax tropicus]
MKSSPVLALITLTASLLAGCTTPTIPQTPASIEGVGTAPKQTPTDTGLKTEIIVAPESELTQFITATQLKIKRHIKIPKNMKGNPEAVFFVTLSPAMKVLKVERKKSSGNAAYDKSVQNAILKASPFPPWPASEPLPSGLMLKFRPGA